MSDSPLREMMSEAGRWSYTPLPSLRAAQDDAHGIMVFEGDDGGQVYIVAPAHLIRCSEETLSVLLQDIDEIEWPGNDADMRRVYFESRKPDSGIPGGMGGGQVTSDVWIHPRLVQRGLAASIRDVLDGRKQRLK